MSTEGDVRRLATALPRVTERTSFGTLAFYVQDKIFARIHEQPDVLVCWRQSVEDREALLAADPRKFFTTDHYRGHASILVRLDHVDTEELAELLAEAWQVRAPKRLVESSAPGMGHGGVRTPGSQQPHEGGADAAEGFDRADPGGVGPR